MSDIPIRCAYLFHENLVGPNGLPVLNTQTLIEQGRFHLVEKNQPILTTSVTNAITIGLIVDGILHTPEGDEPIPTDPENWFVCRSPLGGEAWFQKIAKVEAKYYQSQRYDDHWFVWHPIPGNQTMAAVLPTAVEGMEIAILTQSYGTPAEGRPGWYWQTATVRFRGVNGSPHTLAIMWNHKDEQKLDFYIHQFADRDYDLDGCW